MKIHRYSAGLLCLSLVTTPAWGESEEALAEQARARIQTFATTLQGALKAAIAQGGLPAAIDVCQTQAPAIATQLSQDGWTIGRTSLRERSAQNRPDAWEQTQLEDFDARHATGQPVPELRVSAVLSEPEGARFRYMQAIPTQALCLGCHGDNLAPDVKSALQTRYPMDRATGYREGDLRGAFTVEKRL